MEKTFNIQELKNNYKREWHKNEGLIPFGPQESLYDSGRIQGVDEFLDFIEDKWNLKNES